MEILRTILLILHFVGIAALLGVWFSQIKSISAGNARILPGMMHGAWTMLVTGLGLVTYLELATDVEINHMKIGIKLAVLIAIVVLALINRKKERVSAGVMWAIGGLTLLNIILAVAM
ncbi:hypothetical protein EG850_07425 [Gulosibacter macacae]|uniref:Integral membrane protein n=1 Tax=Gulosibacter macacae TaxID=2488791 RepID=A0A3P3VVL0_9MICO|nr:hypothetical protein [Gulosibacter macacae]RRJ86842.1 hypothetical protein EG850_07425 [Gulosibacter macacae]